MRKFILLLVIFCAFFAVPTKAQFDSIVSRFSITIPDDFNYESEINKLMKLAKQEGDPVYVYDPNLNSTNFSKIDERLVSGVDYDVTIFATGNKDIEGEKCLALLSRDKKNILPGLYGLTLVYRFKSGEIPKNRFIYFFGQENNMGIPCIYPSEKDKDYTFSMGQLSYYLRMYPCVVVFREKKTT